MAQRGPAHLGLGFRRALAYVCFDLHPDSGLICFAPFLALFQTHKGPKDCVPRVDPYVSMSSTSATEPVFVKLVRTLGSK